MGLEGPSVAKHTNALEQSLYTHSSSPDVDMAAKAVRFTLSSFMQDCGISSDGYVPHSRAHVEQALRNECVKHKMNDVTRRYEATILSSVDFAVMAFPHCRTDVQVYIAKCSVAVLLLDNGGASRNDLEAYITQGVSGDNSVLGFLTHCLDDAYDYYTPYAAGVIRASSIAYVNSLILDELMDGRPIAQGCLRFANHQRIASGLGEPFAHFIFDKYNFPDVNTYIQVISEVMVYTSHVNDLMSFYKEELDGERTTYVHQRADATGKGVEEVLYEIGKEISDCVRVIERTLVTGPEIEAWQSFKAGYVYAHMRSGRYRLSELGICVES